jgi:hypothetical protein
LLVGFAISMLQIPLTLQSPLAMLGLLTLLIPLGIHLLSKARPRVIAFAHIAFIKVKTSPILRQLRLTQLILLGLRMCMLILATLILAQLYWPDTNQQTTSHTLLTEDWLNHATDTEKQVLIDQVSGAELVLISTKNRSINKAELAQWLTNNQSTPPLNIWSKVADYTAPLSVNEVVSVYTTNRLKQFIGAKIALSKQVKWHVKTLPIEDMVQQYSMNIKVIYDDLSEPLLIYLRNAFEVINTHKNLSLIVEYTNNDVSNIHNVHLQTYDKIINLSEPSVAQRFKTFDAQWQVKNITQADLNNIKQANFVLIFAQLLYTSQSQDAWLENTRLSAAQITQNSTMDGEQLKRLSTNDIPYQTSLNNTHPATSLHVWLVLMLVAVFILERLLSEWPSSQLKARMDE